MYLPTGLEPYYLLPNNTTPAKANYLTNSQTESKPAYQVPT